MPQRRNSRYGHLGAGDNGDHRTLDDADPEAIGDLVRAVLTAGDAVLFGVTKDAGSVRVILMSGDEKTSQYLNSAEKLNAFCRTVTQHVRENLT